MDRLPRTVTRARGRIWEIPSESPGDLSGSRRTETQNGGLRSGAADLGVPAASERELAAAGKKPGEFPQCCGLGNQSAESSFDSGRIGMYGLQWDKYERSCMKVSNETTGTSQVGLVT